MHPSSAKVTLGIFLSVALAFTQAATPLLAQSTEDVGAAIGKAITSNLKSLDDRLAALEADLEDQRNRNAALETALATMATAFKAELAGQAAALKASAVEATKQASDKIKAELSDMSAATLDGDWTEGKSPAQLLADVAKAAAAADKLKRQLDAQASSLDARIAADCPGLAPSTAAGLAELYLAPETVPTAWTADVVFRARDNGLTLPSCIDGLKDDAGNPLADRFYKDQLAAQESAAAMSSMMMMAMSTGNPIVIAAAMAVMILLALINGNGEGEGSGGGKGGKEGTSKGPSVGDKPGAEISGGDSGTDPVVTTATDSVTPQTSDGSYPNVEEDIGVQVFVNGQDLTFKVVGGDTWVYAWGPPKEGEMELQKFDSSMRIMSATVTADPTTNSFVVQIPGKNTGANQSCSFEYTIKYNRDLLRYVAEKTANNKCV